MFKTIPQDIQGELQDLVQRYDQPMVKTVDIDTTKSFAPLNKEDRYGEVCMVIQRPNGHLLTMTKTHYPPNAYRLPTGGINHHESIYDALLRETYEETGLQVTVERFLAAIAYRTIGQKDPDFYTFAFLLKEIGGTLGVIDESEQIEDFREILPEDLPTIAQNLEEIEAKPRKRGHSDWNDWGRFRAIIHNSVYQCFI